MIKNFLFLILLLSTISCSESDQIVVKLTAQNAQEDKGPKWSPYGQKMALKETNGGMQTQLKIGDNPSNHWALRMTKTDKSEHFNTLYIDQNQNGEFEEEEKIDTEPSESRGKIWSSFNATVYTTVTDPWTGEAAKNVYPISLWYVFDPNEENPEELLRFSRKGWLEGTAEINGVAAKIIMTESTMDAKIDTADNWSIAPQASLKELYDYRNNRSVKTHAWLNGAAYRLVEVHPSGMKVILEPHDPGISQVEEAEQLDIYSADKKAARSGEEVSFKEDFQLALDQAISENKNLFIDFEAVWCGPCKIMDKLVYTADEVVAAAKNTISVKVDGDDYPDLAKRFGVTAYPTLILLGPDEEIIERKVGYQSVRSMLNFLDRAK